MFVTTVQYMMYINLNLGVSVSEVAEMDKWILMKFSGNADYTAWNVLEHRVMRLIPWY